MSDEWSQPEAPPPPMFAGKKERDLVKQVNDELIERVIGQTVAYYPIDMKASNFHPLYGEAIEKTYLPPIRVYALVEKTETDRTYSNNGVDKVQNIVVHFHKRRLTEDQDLFVREGDFLLYDNQFYEISDLSQPRYLFGQEGQKFEITATCRQAREGSFDGR
tara:strand:+ start:536 stop:1021 length:486 start_codon:yes stop_codon:yes gene_type:complete